MKGVLIVTGIAFLLSILLVILDAILNKKETLEEDILKHLPGYNCGACGFGSCSGMAKAILENPDHYQLCKPMRASMKEEFQAYLKEKGLK